MGVSVDACMGQRIWVGRVAEALWASSSVSPSQTVSHERSSMLFISTFDRSVFDVSINRDGQLSGTPSARFSNVRSEI